MIDPSSNYNKLQRFVRRTERNEKQFFSRDFIGLISTERRWNGERWLLNKSIGKSNDNHDADDTAASESSNVYENEVLSYDGYEEKFEMSAAELTECF